MSFIMIVVLILSACLAAAGQLLFRLGASNKTSLEEFFNLWILLGLVCYFMGMVLWFFVLSKYQITSVYAFTILTFILVMFGGVLFLEEVIDKSGLVGSAAVLGGLFIIVLRPFN